LAALHQKVKLRVILASFLSQSPRNKSWCYFFSYLPRILIGLQSPERFGKPSLRLSIISNSCLYRISKREKPPKKSWVGFGPTFLLLPQLWLGRLLNLMVALVSLR